MFKMPEQWGLDDYVCEKWLISSTANWIIAAIRIILSESNFLYSFIECLGLDLRYWNEN